MAQQRSHIGLSSRRYLLRGAVGSIGLTTVAALACRGEGAGQGQGAKSEATPAPREAGYRESAPVISVPPPPQYSKKYPDVTKLLIDYHWSKHPDRQKPLKPSFGGVFKAVFVYTALVDWVKQDNSGAATRAAMTNSNVLTIENGAFARDNVHLAVSTRDGLAERYEQPDQRTYVFTSRDGVKWHNRPPVNGRAFIAEDVKYAWEVMGTMGHHTPLFGQIDRIDVTDSKTMRVTMKQPYAPFLKLMCNPGVSIFSREQWESPDGLTKLAIGTGPFIHVKSDPSVEDIYIRNPDFFLKDEDGRQLPYLDAVHDVRINDIDAQRAAFLSEQLDFFRPSTPPEFQDLRRLKSGLVSQVWPAVMGSVAMFRFNYRNPIFQDVRVRRALSLGLDRTNTYIDTVNLGGAIPPDYLPYHEMGLDWPLPLDQLGPWFKYDPQQARQLLAAAGYGSGLKLEALHFPSRYNAAWVQGAQSDLKEIGVELEPKSTETTAFTAAWINKDWKDIHTQGEMSQKPLDVEGWILDNYTSTSPRNFTGYKDDRVDQFAERQRRELDAQKRLAILTEMRDYLRDQVPIVQVGQVFQLPTWQPYGHDMSDTITQWTVGWMASQMIRAWMDERAPKRAIPGR